MSLTVTMPQLGETVTEGTILKWSKKPGDTILEDEVLLEISTDKVDTEVPSPVAGTILQILVPEGATVAVGTPLVVIGEPGEAGIPAAAPAPAITVVPPPPPPDPAPAPAPTDVPAAAEPTPPLVPVEAPLAAPAPDPAPTAVPAAPVFTPPPVPVAAPPPAPTAAPTPVVAASAAGDLGMLSPVVRRLASEHGVDLSQVAGTGTGGRITRRDLEAHVAAAAAAPAAVEPVAPAAVEPVAPTAVEPARTVLGRGIQDLIVDRPAEHVLFTPAAEPARPAAAAVAPPGPVAALTPVAPAPPVADAPVAAPPVAAAPVAAASAKPAAAPHMAGDEVEDLSRLRVRIAENMIRAKQTAAHVWTSVEVDFELLEQVRQRHRESFKEREGFSLTYLPFITRAVVDALGAYPVVNSSLDLENKVRIMHGAVNLGLGVDLDEGGLVVMTMRGTDGLRMRGIAREVRRLAEKARSGKLEPDDLAGSTFTITNPGPFGSFISAPIINVPNVAILSTETVTKRPVVVTDRNGNDAIAIHHIGYLGLSWDHRAFDGSTAVLFLNKIKQNLETWDWEQELA